MKWLAVVVIVVVVVVVVVVVAVTHVKLDDTYDSACLLAS